MALLEASGIGKNFGETKVLKDISLTLEQGEALAIIGSSGSGKTTLLRCLNFLERPDTGVIRVNGETMWDAADPATQRESEVRKKRLHFGLVFQNFNLFPQYTALENVMLAGELLAREQPGYKADKKAVHARLEAQARELLAQMGLSERAGHYPHQLSGGQQQRVAFARALVMGQEILLLDEPLSNLDAKLRVEVRTELRQIQQKFGITTMYVTHDQDEALSMSDIIAVMRRGRIEQIGSPWEIYFRPATRFVADFVGTVNFLEGTAHREADGSLSVDHRGMRLRVDEDTDLQGGEPVTLVVRPEGISLMGLEETVPEGTALRGTIENYSFLGRMIRYWVRVGEEVFVIDDANVDLTGARTGDVQLRLDTRKLHVLKGGGADAAG